MKGVIVEYKGQNRISIIPSALEMRQAMHRAQQARITEIESTLVQSHLKRSMRVDYFGPLRSDTKCWKNQKHAHKSWMRHLHKCKSSAKMFHMNLIEGGKGRWLYQLGQ